MLSCLDSSATKATSTLLLAFTHSWPDTSLSTPLWPLSNIAKHSRPSPSSQFLLRFYDPCWRRTFARMLSVLPLIRGNSGRDLPAMVLVYDSSEISRVRPSISVTDTWLSESSFPGPCCYKCLLKASAAWACHHESHLDNGVCAMDTYRAFERNVHNQ